MTATAESGSPVDQLADAAAPRVQRWEVAVVALAMLIVALIGAIAIVRDGPLLWDEAVYSLRVRDLVGTGVRGPYWLDVRAPGLPLLLSPVGRLLGVAEQPLRAASLLFAVAGVGITWVIARATLGPLPAAVAACLLAVAPGWHESSWQVMPDIPGTVVTLAAVTVILLAARGGRLSWWVLAAAPLAFLATLIRFGAPLLIGPAVVAAFLLRWSAVRSSPLRTLVALSATAAAAGVVWFVPAVTGARSPPVLIYAARQDAKAIPGTTSAADFLSKLVELVGPVVGPLVVIGVAVAVIAAIRHRPLRAPVVAFAVIATSVLLLMLFGIAEYHLRYLAPALPFLAMLTAVGVVHAVRSAPPRAIVTLGAVVVVAGVTAAAATAIGRADEITRLFGPVRIAYHDIVAVTDRPCVVLAPNPTAEWYTGCARIRPSVDEVQRRQLSRAGVGPAEPVFAVIRHGKNTLNPAPADRRILERIAVDRIDTASSVTVLDLGPAGRFADASTAQRQHGRS